MFRYRLRTLLIVLTVAQLLLGVFLWWRTPYVLHGRHPTGVIAWQQKMQRTFGRESRLLSLIRYYPDGRKSHEYDARMETHRFWSPRGEPIGEWQWFEKYAPHHEPPCE